MNSPGSLSRESPRKATTQRDRILAELDSRWNLKIEVPGHGESPSRRPPPANKVVASSREAFFKINYLCLKDEDALLLALKNFQLGACQLISGWVSKPNADADLLPKSTGLPHLSETEAEQEQLFDCLLQAINPIFQKARSRQVQEPPIISSRTLLNEIPKPIFTPPKPSTIDDVDDTAIPFRLGSKAKGKRLSDGDSDITDGFKRTKHPLGNSTNHKIINAVEAIPVKIHGAKPNSWSGFAVPAPPMKSSILPPNGISRVPNVLSDIQSWIDPRTKDVRAPTSANKSFTSNGGSSVFSHESELSFSTQTSVMNISFERRISLEPEPVDGEESQYGSSLRDIDMADISALTPEEILRERLINVFREYFSCLLAFLPCCSWDWSYSMLSRAILQVRIGCHSISILHLSFS
jgi:hypothetical protein